MDHLMSIDTVFEDLPALTVKTEAEKKLQNGNKLECGDFTDPSGCLDKPLGNGSGEFRIYHSDGTFAAVYALDSEQNILSPLKMF